MNTQRIFCVHGAFKGSLLENKRGCEGVMTAISNRAKEGGPTFYTSPGGTANIVTTQWLHNSHLLDVYWIKQKRPALINVENGVERIL